MDVLFVNAFDIVGILLSRKSDKSLFEHVNLQRIKTRYQTVNSEIKLETVY